MPRIRQANLVAQHQLRDQLAHLHHRDGFAGAGAGAAAELWAGG